jgi:hypothetical protein
VPSDPPIELPAALRRRLGLSLLVPYDTGITIPPHALDLFTDNPTSPAYMMRIDSAEGIL